MSKALDTQVGGNHYKNLAIQPVEYIFKNKLGYFEGCVIKYVTRWKDKGGVQDLEKAKHFLELLIELQNQETKPSIESMRSEQICLNDRDLPQYGQTRHEAIKNLLNEYKRVIVCYKEQVTDKDLQHVADNLRGLDLDIVREPAFPYFFVILSENGEISRGSYLAEDLTYALGDGNAHEIVGLGKESAPTSSTVTVTLPRALSKPQDKMWFITSAGYKPSFYDKNIPLDCFEKGLYFGSEEDAKAWFNAMQDSRK